MRQNCFLRIETQMISAHVKKVIESLNRQASAAAGLSALLREKAAAASSGDPAKAGSAADREAVLVSRLEKAGAETSSSLREALMSAGLPEDSGIREIAGSSALDLEAINSAVLKLAAAMKDLKGLNSGAMMLLKKRLEFSDFTRDAMDRLGAGNGSIETGGVPGNRIDRTI